MGSIYRRTHWHCLTCCKRLDRTAVRKACEAAGHTLDERQSPIYWVQYRRAGKSYSESSESERKGDAVTLLREREGDIVRGKPITPKKLMFDEAAQDLIADYTTNNKRSLGVVQRRVEKHLTPFFTGRRMADITTTLVRAFIAQRQEAFSIVKQRAQPARPKAAWTKPMPDGTKKRIPARIEPAKKEIRRRASNGEINRELALLKRMFSLAIQAGTLMSKPHIPMLQEDNVRTGFFEPEQFASVLAHLPDEVRPVVEVAYISGWRIASEILPLEWRRVDFEAGEIKLDSGTTKNREPRTFPMTDELRAVLLERHAEHLRLKKSWGIYPLVFFREVEGLDGKMKPIPIVSFRKAWQTACRSAGCPGRFPHDLRRTAVRNLVRVGIPERVAMSMTGHKTPSVFQRYNITSGNDLKDAARRMNAARETPNRKATNGSVLGVDSANG